MKYISGSVAIPLFKDPNGDRTVELVRDAATKDTPEVLQRLGTTLNGLTDGEAAKRLEGYGPNEVAAEEKHGWWHRLYTAARNPLVILLLVLAILSFATGDYRAGSVM